MHTYFRYGYEELNDIKRRPLLKLKHIKQRHTILFILLCVVLFAGMQMFFLSSSKGKSKADKQENWSKVLPAHALLHSGDLIFRHGNGFISDAFRAFSVRDKKYSHAGIISIEANQVYVYHAIGGEENVSNKLKKNTLKEFCSSENAKSFGIYRYALSEAEKNQLGELVQGYYQKGLEFDLSFDLQSDDKMYCSEFIYKILTKVKSNKNFLPLSEVNGLKYVAIDDLYLNSACEPIYRFTY